MASGVSRFNFCDKRFFPYLEKVLAQIPDELGDDILGDESLQFISNENFLVAKSLNYRVKPPITHLVYLNTAILKQPVADITYTVAYEFAKYLAAKDNSSSEAQEKKVKELLVEWGFVMDLDSIRPAGPIEESKGYQIGYEWAQRQKLDDLLWNYKEYFDEWHEERISPERFEQLYIDVAPFSILEQLADDEEKKAASEDTLEAEIIWGLMAVIKKLIQDES